MRRDQERRRGKFDYQRLHQRDLMRRVGTENFTGRRVVPDVGWKWWRAGRRLPAPAVQVSKAEMRIECEAAWREWTSGATTVSS